MSTTETLVATASDGSTVTIRTRAGWRVAAVARDRHGKLEIIARGSSPDSVRRRARTIMGSYAFEVVPLRVHVKGTALGDIPPEIREHFDRKREMGAHRQRQVPMITQAWFPGVGGFGDVAPRPATYANIRELRGIGAENLGIVAYGSPVADFPIEPMLRRASLPLLGGSLV